MGDAWNAGDRVEIREVGTRKLIGYVQAESGRRYTAHAEPGYYYRKEPAFRGAGKKKGLRSPKQRGIIQP
jgi:hypothetical protein